MNNIQKDYNFTRSQTTDRMCFGLLGTASAMAAAYLVGSGESSSRITQVATASLAFGATYAACIIGHKIKKNRVDRLLHEQIGRICHPSEEKIQAAWKRIQALPWYPELLHEIQYPAPDIIDEKAEQEWRWTRTNGTATDEEAWACSRKELKGGRCDGITNAIVHSLIANPCASELQVLSSIDVANILYYQMISNCLRNLKKTDHIDAKLTWEKAADSFDEAKSKIWVSSRKNYEKMPITDELEPYHQYVQKILSDKPSPESTIIGKIFIPGHVMGFEIFPNGESRVFQNGDPIYGENIEIFPIALQMLSNDLTDAKEKGSMAISAVFV